MTKSLPKTSHKRIYSVVAGGLGCASLVSGLSNVAIAKQVVTAIAAEPMVEAQTATSTAMPPVAVDADPTETALILPPEYFPPEISVDQASDDADTEQFASAANLNHGKAVNLIGVDVDRTIDRTTADVPSIDLSAIEISVSTPATPPSNGSSSAVSETENPTAMTDEPAVEVPDAAQPNPSAKGQSVDYGTQYIDPTDYSLGATEPTAGPDVVLSERSTGCKTVLRQGQEIPSSLCDAATANSAPADQPAAENSPGSISRPDVNAVRVGAVTIDGRGIHLRRSVRDYYSRTARPKALQSNGDQALMFPLSVPARISSPFGWRIHPIFGNHRLHTGTDMAAPEGTPIVAAFSGRVALSDILGGYGVTVVLQHDERSAQTLYGHMSEVFVKSGEWVEQGTVIGRVGNTGNSTGPHLHFEYRQRTADGWVAVNAGQLLQQALGQVNDGFQLARIAIGSSLEIPELNIPKLLLAGKDATKEASLSATATSSDRSPTGSSVTIANVVNLEAPTR